MSTPLLTNCNPTNSAMFFGQRHEDEAVALCRKCPIVAECGERARTQGEVYGTWGGETSVQRCAWLVGNHPDPDIRDLAEAELRADKRRARDSERHKEKRAALKAGTLLPPLPPTLASPGMSHRGGRINGQRSHRRAQAAALKAKQMRGVGEPISRIAVELNVSERTVNRYLGNQYDVAA